MVLRRDSAVRCGGCWNHLQLCSVSLDEICFPALEQCFGLGLFITSYRLLFIGSIYGIDDGCVSSFRRGVFLHGNLLLYGNQHARVRSS